VLDEQEAAETWKYLQEIEDAGELPGRAVPARTDNQ
jgi:hypothetical protein